MVDTIARGSNYLCGPKQESAVVTTSGDLSEDGRSGVVPAMISVDDQCR